MWGLGVYTDCRGRFGLVQDLMGQKLERYCHIWLACSFDGFAFKWLSTVVLYRPEVCSDTRIDVGQPHYFNGTNKQQNRTKDKLYESALKGCLESVPSKIGVGTSVKEIHIFNNSQKAALQ